MCGGAQFSSRMRLPGQITRSGRIPNNVEWAGDLQVSDAVVGTSGPMFWRDEALPDDHERAWLWTAAIITTQATDDVGQIHDRMPMVIAPDHWADWLNPDSSEPGQLQATMLPAMAGGLTSHPVSMAVNSVRNNGPELIVPLSADPEGPPGELF